MGLRAWVLPRKHDIDVAPDIISADDPAAFKVDPEKVLVGHIPDKVELEGSNRPATIPQSAAGKVGLLLFEGGTKYDAFLVAASAQVGQVMMTLPHSFAEVGMIPGICLQILCAVTSIYTLYLLVILYLHRKLELIKSGLWYDEGSTTKRTAVTQYHEVVGFFTSKLLSVFAIIIVIITAVGTCLPQVIAASSNLYILSHSLEKRTWALIFGGVMCCSCLVPSFRNMRLFTCVAIVSTVYTSLFMIITAGQHGVIGKAWTREPQYGLQNWFDGATTILFTFAGHYMEVLDSMFQPGRFHRHYGLSYPCIMFLTLPTSIMVNWAYTDTIYEEGGNAYALFPKSAQRDVSIILMICHICVAFMLFIHPLFLMAEKVCKVHHKPMWIRVWVRLPVALFIYFIATMWDPDSVLCCLLAAHQILNLIADRLMLLQIINGILGAFTSTFETFVIPTLAFNWTYQFFPENRKNCPKPPFLGLWGKHHWQIVFITNWAIFGIVLVGGAGFGIWAAIAGIIDSAVQWGVFPACYACAK